jgi:hypothetical protein
MSEFDQNQNPQGQEHYKVGLVLGILAIVLGGFLSVVGIIIGIVGLVLSKKNADRYKTKIGFILSAIGIVVGVITLVYSLVVVGGAMMIGLLG